jgi:uncharacterized membrane protein YGL010W
MTQTFFARQLGIYASYHRDPRNRVTHFIGIPAIVFSILVPFALIPIGKIGLLIVICIMAIGPWLTPQDMFRIYYLRSTHVPWLLLIIYGLYLSSTGINPDIGVSCAAVVATFALTGWILLDSEIGLAMIAFMLPSLIIAEWIARSYGATVAWIVFAVFFIGGWVFQLVGHVWEGRRPALLDNLFQAFIGPMFIMAEVLMAFGLKRDLKAVIDHAEAPAE